MFLLFFLFVCLLDKRQIFFFYTLALKKHFAFDFGTKQKKKKHTTTNRKCRAASRDAPVKTLDTKKRCSA
jgi:hypothetical protein